MQRLDKSVSEKPEILFEPATGDMLPFVESYYLFRNHALDIKGVERVDMGQIRFMLKGEGVLTFPDGHSEASCPVMVNGAGTAAASYKVEGPFHCFGVSLRAVGWKALIGLPAHKVADRVLDAVDIFGPCVLPLLERLRGMTTLAEMTAAVEPLLYARRRVVPAAHLALARAVREWAATEEPVIEGLYARVDMSERQVMRLCNEYFGGPPKLLERKFRAIRAAMRIYQGEDPGDVAGRFADQSHMINEVRRFTGHTPGSLREKIDPVLAVTLDNETFHFLPDVIPESVDLRAK
jgi:AraC-like DNA-binding protein